MKIVIAGKDGRAAADAALLTGEVFAAAPLKEELMRLALQAPREKLRAAAEAALSAVRFFEKQEEMPADADYLVLPTSPEEAEPLLRRAFAGYFVVRGARFAQLMRLENVISAPVLCFGEGAARRVFGVRKGDEKAYAAAQKLAASFRGGGPSVITGWEEADALASLSEKYRQKEGALKELAARFAGQMGADADLFWENVRGAYNSDEPKE